MSKIPVVIPKLDRFRMKLYLKEILIFDEGEFFTSMKNVLRLAASRCGKNFKIVIFSDTTNVMNVKLCMVVLLIELYPFYHFNDVEYISRPQQNNRFNPFLPGLSKLCLPAGRKAAAEN